MTFTIGSDLVYAVQQRIAEATFDDAPIVVLVDGTFRVIRFVSYDHKQNVITVHAGEVGVDYKGLREGWRPQ